MNGMEYPDSRPHRQRRAPVGLLLIAVATWTAAGISAGQRNVFRTGIELVNVTATVTEESGRYITGLTPADFQVFEDGVPQEVSHVTTGRVPVSLGLLVDVSDSMYGQRMVSAQLALERFLVGLLAPTDETFLMSFNHRPSMEAGWTLEPATLASALGRVRPFGGTAIYDAIAAAIPEFETRKHARAAMVVISDGADTASDESVVTVRTLLRRSPAFVYAVAIDDAASPINTRVDPHALRAITDDTGGYTEVVPTVADLDAATARIADELNQQYVLGYTPSHAPDEQYHSIRVRTRNPDHHVRARRGYVAKPQKEGPPRRK